VTETRARQSIRYVRTHDGVRLAWAEAGTRGPVLLKASNWLSHLEYEWENPVWRHWIHFYIENFRSIRYDERGCGMSDWRADDLSPANWIEDLESVVAAAAVETPMVLLALSQGAAPAIEFAVRHPERVSHLVIYGGYALGWARRGDSEAASRFRALIELVEHGWGSDNPVFRQLFTSRFLPEGSREQIAWFNELCLKTVSPENAARLLEARAEVDVAALLREVRVPTLVLHGRRDEVVPISAGRYLASEIPGAEFVELDSRNHILLEEEPAWRRFQEAMLDFCGVAGRGASAVGAGEDPAFAALSPRERETLALVAEGLGNAEIAARLEISDKTVRNHVSNLFDKLGVWTRAQAIVFARDRGFRGTAPPRGPSR
jgi:pimeloyl-ACP methyl ester carboxylesterase/DNA-binding CsgD family transcriptional regulator